MDHDGGSAWCITSSSDWKEWGGGFVHNSRMILSWGCDMCTSKSYNRTQGARGIYISESRRSWEVGFVFFLCSEQYLVHFGDSALIHLAQSVKVHPK